MAKLVVYALMGSEYVGTTLAGLQSRGIKHAVKVVSIDPKKRKLPSGGKLVPEITYEDPEKGIEHTIVTDSAKIFEYFDEHLGLEHKFAEDKSEEYEALRKLVSEGLASIVRYYAWIFSPTWKATMLPRIQLILPMQGALGPSGWLKGLGSALVGGATKKAREHIKLGINSFFEIVPADSSPKAVAKAINDSIEPQVYSRLVEILSEKVAPHVLARRKSHPDDFVQRLNSVECYVFSMLGRLISTAGDAGFDPTVKERLTQEESLKELCEWFFEVESKIPLQWHNLHPRDVYPEPEQEEAAASAEKADAPAATEEPAAAEKDAAEEPAVEKEGSEAEAKEE